MAPGNHPKPFATLTDMTVNFAIEGALPKGVKVGNLVAYTKDPELRLGRLIELKDEYGIVVI